MAIVQAGGATILVVEDQALVRMEAVDALEQAGFRVVEAPDARAALAVLESRPDISLLFTDVEMPGGMDGVDLAREVHARWPKVLLLVTSAGVDIKDEDLPDDGKFVAKPYPTYSLIAQVRRLMAAGHGPSGDVTSEKEPIASAR